MTTIAYCHKDREISIDSRATAGNTIISDSADKVYKRNGQTFYACGGRSDCISLIDVYFGKEPTKREYDAAVMTVVDGFVFGFTFEDGAIQQWPIMENYSLGSGCDFALAAMDFGKSAAEAVEYAATRDCRTGGKIRAFKVGA